MGTASTALRVVSHSWLDHPLLTGGLVRGVVEVVPVGVELGPAILTGSFGTRVRRMRIWNRGEGEPRLAR